MPVVLEGVQPAQRVLELVGVFAFATSGALLAVRKGFDIVGMLVLAWITALGGGVLRDIIVGDIPPAAFIDIWIFCLPIAASAIVYFAHQVIARWMRPVLLFDAAGLALFTVIGTVKGVAFDLDIPQAAAVGVMTGVGGGLLRDIVAREIPAVVRADTELYAVPAMVGAFALAVSIATWGYDWRVGSLIAMLIFVFRVAALGFGWRAPRAWRASGEDTG